MIETINPATGAVIQRYEYMTLEVLQRQVSNSHSAFLSWSTTALSVRKKHIQAVSATLRKQQESLAQLITEEMGKSLQESQSEIEKCALLCDYYLKNVERFLTPEVIATDYKHSYVRYEPTGIIFAVMPWNFPFWQVFRFAIPNLLLGNVGLLKHAANVTGCALAIETIFKASGLPEHVFKTLVINHQQSEELIADARIAGVTLTGSEAAGQSVATAAGKALKKVVLELGGSDPYVVTRHADIEKAVKAIVASRLNNSGQVCIAAKRIIVDGTIHAAFVASLLKSLSEKTIAPLARDDLRSTLQSQVEQAISEGATCLIGGKIAAGDGFYYPVTVLDHVSKENIAFQDELFGPVFCISISQNNDEAVQLANDSPFGLGAAVFSEDLKEATDLAERIHAGAVAINTFVASNPALPFGGTKRSGFGRELARDGLLEFANHKTIVVS